MTNPLIRKFEQRHPLGDEERQVLNKAITRVVDFGADEDMAREHDRPTESKLLLEGWANRYMTTAEGGREIVAVHIAGDFIDLQSFPLNVMDHNIGTFTPCKVALVSHNALDEIIKDFPHLTRLLWMHTLVDGAIYRKWLLNVGRKTAFQRMAHLLCELLTRLKVVGLAEDRRFEVPITQQEFGDSLGVSNVHMNRIVQQLRTEKLVTWHGSSVLIEDWETLSRVAEFDPTYLNLQAEPL